MIKPTKCITENQARELYDNWTSTRAVDIDTAMGFVDAREVFYSLEELQDFLDYVKAESTKQSIPNPGIRIYFGAYNDFESNKATVFLAPTSGDTVGSSNNYKIESLNKGQTGWPPKVY